ncbi:WD40/YVTN/BNR-like repeat-containing protein [Silvanigrella aquatica]|uniref:Uncharacterized protein n=1 Tax=Silvanigrella aquatica TaxID=1915309 RepID=A0A1L4D2W0_9BACT|nr:hypothetical protein [Silvanigrella aquatica]APJ04545.1 hypothetical protein AXG55_11770 [Silvanigrella aquatica]
MISKYFYLLNKISIILSVIFLISCGKENETHDSFLIPELIVKQSYSFSEHTTIDSNDNLILKGTYQNCEGHSEGDSWSIGTSSDYQSFDLLRVKEKDIGCELHLSRVDLTHNKINYHKILDRKNSILKSEFFSDNIPLPISKKKENKKNYETKIDYVQKLYANVKMINHNFLDTPKIEVVIMNTDENNISEEILTGQLLLSVKSENNFDDINLYKGGFSFKKIKFQNEGDFNLSIKKYSYDDIYNNTCDKNSSLNTKSIYPEKSFCYADLLIVNRNFQKMKNIFRFKTDYFVENDDRKTGFKSNLFYINIKNLDEGEIKKSNELKNESIYRVYNFHGITFATLINNQIKNVKYSINGMHGKFKNVSGIDDNSEITNMVSLGDIIYALTNKSVLYFYDVNKEDYRFEKFELLNGMKVKSIASNDDVLIIATSKNNLLYLKEGVLSPLCQDMKFCNNNKFNLNNIPNFLNDISDYSISKIFLFQNNLYLVLDLKKYSYGVLEESIYFSPNFYSQNFERENIKLPYDSSINEITKYKNLLFIGTSNGLYYCNKDEKNKCNLAKIDDLKNNEIYDLKIIDNILYVASPCKNSDCSSNGIHLSYLNKTDNKEVSFPKFKEIFSGKIFGNMMSVTVDNEKIYATTTSGFYYKKKNFLDSNDSADLNTISNIHLDGDKLYFLQKGNEDGLYFSRHGGKGFKTKKNIKNSDFVSSINVFQDRILAVIRNPKEGIDKFGKYEKGVNKYEFNGICAFELNSVVAIAQDKNKFYIATKEQIISMDSNNHNFLKEIFNDSNKEIKNIFINNNVFYILTKNQIHYADMSDEKMNFKNSFLTINDSRQHGNIDFNSIYVKNNIVYLATSKGLWLSNTGVNGVFNKEKKFGDDNISSVTSIGTVLYLIKNGSLISESIEDYPKIFKKIYDIQYDNKNLSNRIINKIELFENKIFLATNQGLKLSNNYGREFQDIIIQKKLKSTVKINSVIFYNNYLFLGTSNGLYISKDFGKSFEQPLFDYKNKSNLINSIDNMVQFGSKIYFISGLNMFYFDLKVINEYIIKKSGYKIIIHNSDLSILRKIRIKKLFSNEKSIFAVTQNNELYHYSPNENGDTFKLLKYDQSEDKPNLVPSFGDIANVSPTINNLYCHNNDIYIATSQGYWFSHNSGENFQNITSTSDNGLGTSRINSIYKLGTVLYLGTDLGLFFSSDGGQSFLQSNVSLNENKVRDIYFQPYSGEENNNVNSQSKIQLRPLVVTENSSNSNSLWLSQ